jgi:sulfotransferase family protein
MQEISLVSSQFPSGVTWLLNFFLEINIAISRGQKISDMWQFDEKKEKYKLQEFEKVLKTWMPTLFFQAEFSFKDDTVVKWHHDFPNKKNTSNKTILFVRDGRDAIYSLFKREGHFYDSYEQMLQNYIKPFSLPPALTWASFNFLWSKIIPTRKLFIIKFEDIKTNPLPVLQNLLSFLEITRTRKEIEKAIKNSSFEMAKKAEQAYKKQTQQKIRIIANRRGKTGEWQEIYSQKELQYFDQFPCQILKQFSYSNIKVGKRANRKQQKNNLLIMNKIITIYAKDHIRIHFGKNSKVNKVYKQFFNNLSMQSAFLIKLARYMRLKHNKKEALQIIDTILTNYDFNSRDLLAISKELFLLGKPFKSMRILVSRKTYLWLIIITKEYFDKFLNIWSRYKISFLWKR